jgi:hypothetical protein
VRGKEEDVEVEDTLLDIFSFISERFLGLWRSKKTIGRLVREIEESLCCSCILDIL